jgi:L-arabinonolactonase
MNVSRLGEIRCVVGEGPVWLPEEQALYFVDIVGQWIGRFDAASGDTQRWQTPSPVAAVAFARSAGLLAVLADGVYELDAGMEHWRLVARAEIDPALTPFNDAKTDRQGRLLAGTCVRGFGSDAAGLYRLKRCVAGDEMIRVDGGYTLVNGPCWSPCGETLYCADSIRKIIYAYDYDVTTGEAHNRRILVDTRPHGGMPDGATVDVDGRLWVAMCEAGLIACFDPRGRLQRTISMPTAYVAGVAFGGPNLDRLFVTSLDPSVVGKAPDALAGALFVVDGLGVRGLPEARVADVQ